MVKIIPIKLHHLKGGDMKLRENSLGFLNLPKKLCTGWERRNFCGIIITNNNATNKMFRL